MHFKIIAGLSVLVTVLAGIVFGPTLRDRLQQQIQNYWNVPTTENPINYKTTRNIPENADLGAFLAGNIAFSQNNYQVATHYYEKVLKNDSQNTDIKERLLVLNGIQGNMQRTFELIHDLSQTNDDVMFQKQLILADLIYQKKYQEAKDYLIKHQDESPQLFDSLAMAWIEAGLNHKKEAFAALENIDKSLMAIKIQHQAMLHMYFNEKKEAKEKILLFNEYDVPIVNSWLYILNILSFDELLNQPKLLKQFQKILKTDTYLSDVLAKSIEAPNFSPQTGMGDVFYLLYATVETLAQKDKTSANKNDRVEQELILLNTALLLDNQVLYQLIISEKSLNAKLYDKVLSVNNALLKKNISTRIKEHALLQKAMALIGLNRANDAYEILYNLAKYHTTNFKVYELLIIISTVIEDYQNALNFYDKIIALPSVHKVPQLMSRLYTGRSAVYYRLNRKEEMVKDLLKALLLDDKNTDALNSLGYELIDQETNIQKGLELVKRAYQLAPNVSYISDSVAWGYYKLKQYDQAIRYGEIAARLPHDSAVINMHLGDIYLAVGRINESNTQYRKALMIKEDLTPEMEKKIKNQLKIKSIKSSNKE